MWNLFKKQADPMQQIQTDPALAEMEAVAAKFREDRNHWRARAIDAEAKLARMTAPLREANEARRAKARAANA
jgi:hypothetical protein